MAITALETHHAGCRFRSRLEARWAVFFDTLGIKWEYEPQGYVVGKDKRPYLPDFRLPELRTVVEVKGDADRLDVGLLAELTRAHGDDPFTVVLGPVPAVEAGRTPTHMLFMPVFDFADYAGGRGVAHASLVNTAFGAIEKLDEGDRKSVTELISHECRTRIASYTAFFIGSGGHWALMPFGAANITWAPDQILNPGSIWPLLPQPKLIRAYEAARSARFEHGERGQWRASER